MKRPRRVAKKSPSARLEVRITLHGVLLRVLGIGVLLTGVSGVGKSELALELLSRGHQLIADDAVEFNRSGAQIVGRCPPLLYGFLEARNLGILNVHRMFGPRCLRQQQRLNLVIELHVREDGLRSGGEFARLDGRRDEQKILGVTLPQVCIPIRLGHNLAVLVEAACRDLKLRAHGYHADRDLTTRQLLAIKDNSRTP